jgi:MarR family transcriptional regulator for hemolysin
MSADDDSTLDSDLCILLARASHSLLSELAAAIEPLGLTPREHEVMSAAMNGEHTQADLARMIDLDKTTMVNTLDQLEAAGLAERRPLPGDRRVRVIFVTAAGKRKVREANKVIHAVHEDVLATLPKRTRDGFSEGLRQLVNERLAEPRAGSGSVRRRSAPRSR